MESSVTSAIHFSRVQRAYERARLMRATIGVLPFALFAVVAVCCGTNAQFGIVAGALLVGGAGLALWRGEAVGRSVLPGVAWGVIPFGFALIARASGHFCTGSACVSWCIPACAAGGVAAGLGLFFAGRRSPRPWVFWGAGAALALLTGSLGCSCVGAGGVIGLALGLSISVVPMAARKWIS